MNKRLIGVAAVSVVIGTISAGLVLDRAGAASVASSVVTIQPCRLVDTRPAPEHVGERAGALGSGETVTIAVVGTHGNCTIPTGTTGIVTNVTILNTTAASFLTIYPSGGSLPLASNLNWSGADTPPTPNQVSVGLSMSGAIDVYNLTGKVDVIIDIVGYLIPGGGGGTPGPKGDRGDQGAPGQPGPRPSNVVWVAKSGGDFTSLSAALASITDNSVNKPYLVKIAPGRYAETDTVLLKDYVDVEGSGEYLTAITCACGTVQNNVDSATIGIVGNLHTHLRDLSVLNSGGNLNSFGVALSGALTTVSLDHVTTLATGGSIASTAVFNDGITAAKFSNVTAQAIGGFVAVGIDFSDTTGASLTDVTVSASSATTSRGVWMHNGGGVLIRDSSISGTNNSVFFQAGGPVSTVHIANSVLSGVTAGVGGGNCVDVLTSMLGTFTCA